MKQDAQPTAPCPSDAFADAVAKGDRRARQTRFNPVRRLDLKSTSVTDVVFLLLIFFLVTATFHQQDEGSLKATMPGNSTPDFHNPQMPMMIELSSADDGMTYHIEVQGRPLNGATELSDYLRNNVRTGSLAKDDLVQIHPQGVVRWQHVVNVFNACVSAELEQVGFSGPALADAGAGHP